MTPRPKRYRYILRVELPEGRPGQPRGGGVGTAFEALLVRVAKLIPGAQLSRNEYDDHGEFLMKTGRKQLVP